MIAKELDRVRFAPEKALLEEMREQFALDDIIEHLASEETASPYHQLIMAQHLRLTPLLAPRIYRVFERVTGDLAFDEQMDLYVHADSDINAVALQRLDDDSAHLVSLTSEMVRSMTDEELRFAIGHEVGHLAFEHHRVLLVQMMLAQQNAAQRENNAAGQDQTPQLLQRRMEKWNRLAEFSADRVGFHACGGDLSVAVSVFFKMASGLGPEDLNFDIGAFCDQLARVQSLDRREVLAIFSHPATPVRARALQLYSEAGGVETPVDTLQQIDGRVAELAKLMDFELASDLGTQAREFFVSAGLLAAHADGDFDEREQDILVRLLLQVTSDPESHLASIGSVEEAQRRLADACTWLRANAGQERFALFGQLANIVCVDGVVDRNERAFMMEVASMLEIPGKAAKDILHQVLSQHVQTKTTRKMGAFGFRSS